MDYLSMQLEDLPVIYGPCKSSSFDASEALSHFRYLLNDLDGIREKFFHLGFHLAEFRRNNYYLDLGFSSLEDFALVNLNMDKSAVSRCISVFENFNATHDVTYACDYTAHGAAIDISDRYRDYSYSQLVEMVPMDPDTRLKCSPDMTVLQLRELKKSSKSKGDPIGELGKIIDHIKDKRETLSESDNVSQVAMSQQKFLTISDLFNLHGNALKMKVSYADPVCIRSLMLFDSEGNLLSFGNHLCCVLLQTDSQIALRLLPEAKDFER